MIEIFINALIYSVITCIGFKLIENLFDKLIMIQSQIEKRYYDLETKINTILDKLEK
jgi:hypothetical protein